MFCAKAWGAWNTDWKLFNYVFFCKFQKCHHIWLAIIVLSLLIVLMIRNVSYYKRNGIKSPPGMVPFIGHFIGVLLRREHLKDQSERSYKAFPDEKYVGEMFFTRPVIMLRDLDLIKQVMITNFDHFVNHGNTMQNDLDSIFANHLYALKDDKWRQMRSTLTPTFSTSKVRDMFGFVEQTAQQVATTFMKKLQSKDSSVLEMDIKDAFARYINDVIATSTFGLIIDSLNHPNNHFYEMGKMTTSFNHTQAIKFVLLSQFPKFTKMIGLQLYDDKIKNFFRGLVLNTMKFREKEGIFRPDMIHLLKEARHGRLKYTTTNFKASTNYIPTFKESRERISWTDDDIVAQAMLFFILGFDNSSNLLCYIAYELIKNPHVQKKLQEEVDEIVAKKGKRIAYEDLCETKYMDAVIAETMRLWPAGVYLDRCCVKPFKLPPTSENDGFTLQVGDTVHIPIYSLHHDEKYFPGAETFNPDRFLGDNHNNAAFMPFGCGPRNCIGRRFAMMMVKCLLFHLIVDIEFVATPKTRYPAPSNVLSMWIDQKSGLWIGIKARRK